MNFTVDAYWFYGFEVNDLITYEYSKEECITLFHFRGEKFGSSWYVYLHLKEKYRIIFFFTEIKRRKPKTIPAFRIQAPN